MYSEWQTQNLIYIILSLFYRLFTDWVSACRSMARFYMAGVISMHQPSSKVYPPTSSNLSYSGLYICLMKKLLSLSLSLMIKVHPKFMLLRFFPIDILNVIICKLVIIKKHCLITRVNQLSSNMPANFLSNNSDTPKKHMSQIEQSIVNSKCICLM